MSERFSKFRSLSFPEKALFFESLFLQLWVGLLLKAIPFRWIPRMFADARGAGHTAKVIRNKQQGTLILIKSSVQRASKVSPWKNKCLISSLAARCMLRRRKIASQISLGMIKDKHGVTTAHAWLMAENIEIVEKRGDYRELYDF